MGIASGARLATVGLCYRPWWQSDGLLCSAAGTRYILYIVYKISIAGTGLGVPELFGLWLTYWEIKDSVHT